MLKKRLIITLIFLFVSVSLCFGAETWGIFYTGTSFKEMKAGIANVNKKNGMIPVGISYYGNKIYFMFIKHNRIKASNYLVDTFALNLNYKQRSDRIQGKVNEGWIPFDLTITPDKGIILYLKANMPIQSWKIVGSSKEWGALQKKIVSNRGYFPLGFTFIGQKAYTLVIKSSGAGISRWVIKNCGTNNTQISAKVTEMMNQGYLPYGFEYQGNQVGVCFLK